MKKANKFLFIVVDEFGKVLEHAAKNNPERELYFLQKLAEFVNVPSRNIILLTTLHQNFGAYAGKLTDSQRNEWLKVKGRYKELVFSEPVQTALYRRSSQYRGCSDRVMPTFFWRAREGALSISTWPKAYCPRSSASRTAPRSSASPRPRRR